MNSKRRCVKMNEQIASFIENCKGSLSYGQFIDKAVHEYVRTEAGKNNVDDKLFAIQKELEKIRADITYLYNAEYLRKCKEDKKHRCLKIGHLCISWN